MESPQVGEGSSGTEQVSTIPMEGIFPETQNAVGRVRCDSGTIRKHS